MNSKFQSIFNLIKAHKTDCFISTSLITREWLIEANTADFCLIFARNNKIHVFVDERDITNLKKHNPNLIAHLYKDINTWLDFCKTQKLKSVLFEDNTTSYEQYIQYIKPLKTKLVSISADDLRIVKTTDELKKLQKSADIITAAIEHLKRWTKVGHSEIAVAKELYKYVMAHGASGLSFQTIVSFGENAADIHSVPTNRKLKKNEVILVDAGCICQGYCSDITRVWWIGTPPKQIKEMYDVVLKTNLLGIKNAKANVIGSRLDAVCRNFIKQNWHNYDIPHGVGHGVGRLIHENPRINKIYHKSLPINSVVTIEPGIYNSKIGGVRIEDTILITKNGCKVLTSKSPK